MKTLRTILAAAVLVISTTVLASPDHDHGAPTFQPPKGGILKSTHMAHFELVKSANSVSLYAYNKEGKALPTKGLKVSADLELPRQKPTPVSLTDKETHWEATIDSKSAHRYSLKVKIDDGKEKDNVKFTVENK